MYKKNDIYIQAVANLYEEENKKTEKEQNKEKQKGRKIIWKLKR